MRKGLEGIKLFGFKKTNINYRGKRLVLARSKHKRQKHRIRCVIRGCGLECKLRHKVLQNARRGDKEIRGGEEEFKIIERKKKARKNNE